MAKHMLIKFSLSRALRNDRVTVANGNDWNDVLDWFLMVDRNDWNISVMGRNGLGIMFDHLFMVILIGAWKFLMMQPHSLIVIVSLSPVSINRNNWSS